MSAAEAPHPLALADFQPASVVSGDIRTSQQKQFNRLQISFPQRRKKKYTAKNKQKKLFPTIDVGNSPFVFSHGPSVYTRMEVKNNTFNRMAIRYKTGRTHAQHVKTFKRQRNEFATFILVNDIPVLQKDVLHQLSCLTTRH